MSDNLYKHISAYGSGSLVRTEMVTIKLEFFITNVMIVCVDYEMSNGLCVDFHFG